MTLYSEITNVVPGGATSLLSTNVLRYTHPAGTSILQGTGSLDRIQNVGDGDIEFTIATFSDVINHQAGTITEANSFNGNIDNLSTGTIVNAVSVSPKINNRGSGTIQEARSVEAIIENSAGGTINNVQGLRFQMITQNPASNVGTIRGISLDSWQNIGTVSESYGIYLDNSIGIGATSYAIFSASNADSYLSGNLGLGTTLPSHKLHVADNTTDPVRIEGLQAGTGDVVVVDGADVIKRVAGFTGTIPIPNGGAVGETNGITVVSGVVTGFTTN